MPLHFDADGLKELLVDFHTLTHIRASVYDADMKKLIAYPEKSCHFCSLLKANPSSLARCKSCDRDGFLTCKESGKIRSYRCHAGLTEGVAPIRMHDTIIGYIMFGQIIDPALKKTARQTMIDYCSGYCGNAEEAAKAFDRLCGKNEQQIRAAAKIMEGCACYLWINQLIKMDAGSLGYQISVYIEDHLSEDLSAAKLCRIFDVSRSRLFEISKQYFGVSIARHIKKRRMQTAAQLLEDPQRRIGEVAALVGIEDQNYFSKMFKAEMGSTPSTWRTAHQI